MTLLFQDKELMELMQDFYILTGIKIALFDENFEELISYPLEKKTFCMHMRENEDFRNKCLSSNRQACLNCNKTGSLNIYKCHIGLIEAVAPVKENGRIIGYMMFGQVSDNKNKDELMDKMTEVCRTFNIDKDLSKSIRKIKYRNNKQILAAAKILDAFAEYILLKEMVQLSGKQLIDSIESYINNHIDEEITIERLCQEFNIKRTRLYNIMQQYTSGGVANFIRKKRLEKAKLLIKTTEMKIPEISNAVGFSDYNYFLRVFKKQFGISPKKYRK
ncbi:MAG: helix-turn-helix domain-containing protein [Ruminococcaceae bacterium]|nr:helix-turn-helix domain-containing protein [Oscillospiraceae bacterium]